MFGVYEVVSQKGRSIVMRHYVEQQHITERGGEENSIIIISNLSKDRSKASSKTIPPHSAF